MAIFCQYETRFTPASVIPCPIHTDLRTPCVLRRAFVDVRFAPISFESRGASAGEGVDTVAALAAVLAWVVQTVIDVHCAGIAFESGWAFALETAIENGALSTVLTGTISTSCQIDFAAVAPKTGKTFTAIRIDVVYARAPVFAWRLRTFVDIGFT